MQSSSSPTMTTEELDFCAETLLRCKRRPLSQFDAQIPNDSDSQLSNEIDLPPSYEIDLQPSNEVNLQSSNTINRQPANESNPQQPNQLNRQPDNQSNVEPLNQSDGTTQTRRENLVQHQPRYKGIVSKFIQHRNFGFIHRYV